MVPAGDLRNERFGGPMLLRVPPASLAEVDTYARHLSGMAMPLDSVVTEMDFDPGAQYPKIRLKAARVLTDEEYAIIEEVAQSPIVNRILDTNAELAATTDGIDETRVEDPGIPPIQQVQQPPAGFVPQARPEAQAAVQPRPEPQPAPRPAPPPPQPIPPQPDDDGVLMEEEPDENRQKLRDMKLTEAQINAALGPPKMRPVPVGSPKARTVPGFPTPPWSGRCALPVLPTSKSLSCSRPWGRGRMWSLTRSRRGPGEAGDAARASAEGWNRG